MKWAKYSCLLVQMIDTNELMAKAIALSTEEKYNPPPIR